MPLPLKIGLQGSVSPYLQGAVCGTRDAQQKQKVTCADGAEEEAIARVSGSDLFDSIVSLVAHHQARAVARDQQAERTAPTACS